MGKSDKGVTVVVASFSNDHAAQAALSMVKQAKKDVGLHDAAIVRRMGDKVQVQETKDMGFGKGAVIGGLVAAVATGGLSIVGGAIIGGVAAKAHDANLSNKQLKALGEALPDGSDAIVALVDQAGATVVTDILMGAGAESSTIDLDADTAARLLGTAKPAAADPTAEAASDEAPADG